MGNGVGDCFMKKLFAHHRGGFAFGWVSKHFTVNHAQTLIVAQSLI